MATTTITLYFPSLQLIFVILSSFLPFHLEGSNFTTITTQKALINESSRLLDLILRDYTLNSFRNQHYSIKTGDIRRIHLPSNYSGIILDAVRFRCGSFRRYGAQIKEFHIGIGAILEPCGERFVIVRQNLGTNWSDIYYKNYDLSGYRLVSPVLGLLAYNALNDVALGNNVSSSYQINVLLSNGKDQSTVDFGNVSGSFMVERTLLNKPMCATFELDGKVTFASEVKPFVCGVESNGHFGLVVKDDHKSDGGGGKEMKKEKNGRWRSVVGGLVGSVTLGVVLLGLVVAAVAVAAKRRKRRIKREEMERKAYEEEALRVVSMVGHSRVLVASATRTLPGFMEHECIPN